MIHGDENDSFSNKKPLQELLVRITIYYAVVVGVLWLIGMIYPGFVNELPIGGVSQMAGYDNASVYEMEQALLGDELGEVAAAPVQHTRFAIALDDALDLLMAMVGTLVLMSPVAWVYSRIHNNDAHDHSLDETALILPAVVAGIVLVVQHSLALAFSLAGIVAGVQFRRALSDTFDTLFIFVAIGVGIAAGIKALEIAVVMTVFFNYTTIIVCGYGDGLESHYRLRKKQRRKERKMAREEQQTITETRDAE